ncbi:hypothetical protein Taro_048467 [Colocasia esculenta]|uniref:Uncharacterized protein n=1 Tax=Colocasia esculenta TaxID=4460 RepID=A0A843X876_COLES|nr:hypothetical protein [Colocasia esculenta]
MDEAPRSPSFRVSGEDYDKEEEHTSDECEDDDEDGAELDISSSSEEEMDIIEKLIWCVEHDRAKVLGGG